MELNETDLKIIKLLKKDSRISYTDLGKKLDLSDVAVKKRIDKLVSQGVIKNFSINISNEKIGKKINAFLLVNCAPEDVEKAIQKFEKIPETESISKTIGEYDLIVELLCKDITDLKNIVEDKFSSMKGVNSINALIKIE